MKEKLQKNGNLGIRLSGYAASAGALACLATHVDAQVQYSGVQDILVGANTSYDLDLDGDGTIDFQFYVMNSTMSLGPTYYYAFRYGVMLNPGGTYNNSWLLGTGGNVAALPDAALVSSAAGTWANDQIAGPPAALGYSFLTVTSLTSTAYVGGNFIGAPQFAGVRFHIGADLHYGWVRISVASDISSVTIHDWAYEATTGTAMDTDDSGPVPALSPNVLPRTNIQEVVVNVSFDEEVSGLEISDFQLFNCTASSLTPVTPGLEYNLVVSAGVHGNVSVTLPAGAVTDVYGYANSEAATNWFYDDRLPVITMDPGFSGSTNVATHTINITASEGILDLDLSDFVVTNGIASNLVEVVLDTEFTLQVTATAEGPVTVNLPQGSVNDYGQNQNEETEISWEYDTTPPAVTLTPSVTGTTNAETVVVTLAFAEDVSGLELVDLVVTNGTAANLTEVSAGLEYTVEITADGEGEVIVELPAAMVADAAGNENSAVETSWIFDGTAPQVTLDNGVTGSTNQATVPVSIVFDEAVSGLTLDDFTITNGTAANLTELTAGMEFAVDITAGTDGEVVVVLDAGAVVDEGGNENAEASTSWDVDLSVPVATLDAGVDLTNMATVEVSITFSEPITGLDISELVVTNGSAANLTEVAAGTDYTVDITATADGIVGVQLPAGAVADEAGNENGAVLVEWGYDGTVPVATLDLGVEGTTDQETITIDLSFNEAVTGFEVGDLVVTNGSASNLTELTAGTTYTVDITAVAEGEVTVELPDGAVADEAGNENEAVSDSYTYDVEDPDAIAKVLSDGVRFYPNPASSFLTLELEEPATVNIVSTNGRVALTQENVLNETLDVSNLPKGVYVLHLEDLKGTRTYQFVVE